MLNQIFKNLRASIGFKIVQFLTNFFVIAFVIRTVGITKWGVLTLSLSLVVSISFLQSGFASGLARDLSKKYFNNDLTEFNKLLINAIMLSFIIVLIIIIINCIFIILLKNSYVLFNDENLVVYLVILSSILVQILQIPLMAAFQSINKISILEYINMFTIGIRILLVFSLFYFSKTILTYSFILFIESIIRISSMYILLRKTITLYSFKQFIKNVKTRAALEIIKSNTYIILNNINYLMLTQFTIVSLSNFYSLEIIGYFGIAFQINSLVRSSTELLDKIFAPILNILNAQKKNLELFVIYNFTNNLFYLFSGAIFLFLISVGNKLYLILINSKSQELLILLNYFSWFIFFGIISIPITNLLITINKIKRPSIFSLLSTLIYLILLNTYNFKELAYIALPLLIGSCYLIGYGLKTSEGYLYLIVNSFIKSTQIYKYIIFISILIICFIFGIRYNNIEGSFAKNFITFIEYIGIVMIISPFFFKFKDYKQTINILRTL